MDASNRKKVGIRRRRPAQTAEARENQIISLAVDLAERQIAEGTASSQVLVHFLKLGTVRAKLEMEKLKHEAELLKAKTDALESAGRMEDLYKDAMLAFTSYQGNPQDEEIIDD